MDPERMVLTERERLFATAALNSSCLPIMSSNREHLWMFGFLIVRDLNTRSVDEDTDAGYMAT